MASQQVPSILARTPRPVSTPVGCLALCFSSIGELLVSHVNTLTIQRHGPSIWNLLPLEIPKSSMPLFYMLFKTYHVTVVGLGVPLSRFPEGALYKFPE